jgi:hypothetical protein
MGFGVIRLLHRDIADVLQRAILALRFDPENRFVNMVLEKSASLTPHRLREISLVMFFTLRWTLSKAPGWCWRRDGPNISL